MISQHAVCAVLSALMCVDMQVWPSHSLAWIAAMIQALSVHRSQTLMSTLLFDGVDMYLMTQLIVLVKLGLYYMHLADSYTKCTWHVG